VYLHVAATAIEGHARLERRQDARKHSSGAARLVQDEPVVAQRLVGADGVVAPDALRVSLRHGVEAALPRCRLHLCNGTVNRLSIAISRNFDWFLNKLVSHVQHQAWPVVRAIKASIASLMTDIPMIDPKWLYSAGIGCVFSDDVQAGAQVTRR